MGFSFTRFSLTVFGTILSISAIVWPAAVRLDNQQAPPPNEVEKTEKSDETKQESERERSQAEREARKESYKAESQKRIEEAKERSRLRKEKAKAQIEARRQESQKRAEEIKARFKTNSENRKSETEEKAPEEKLSSTENGDLEQKIERLYLKVKELEAEIQALRDEVRRKNGEPDQEK